MSAPQGPREFRRPRGVAWVRSSSSRGSRGALGDTKYNSTRGAGPASRARSSLRSARPAPGLSATRNGTRRAIPAIRGVATSDGQPVHNAAKSPPFLGPADGSHMDARTQEVIAYRRNIEKAFTTVCAFNSILLTQRIHSDCWRSVLYAASKKSRRREKSCHSKRSTGRSGQTHDAC